MNPQAPRETEPIHGGGGSPSRKPAMLRAVDLGSATTDSMARRGALSTLGVVFQGGARFVMNVVVGRIGGPSVLGTVATAISTAQLFSLLSPTTIGSAATKFIAQARGRESPSETAAIAAHLGKRTVQAGLVLSFASVPVWILVDHGGFAGAGAVALLIVGYSGYGFTKGLQFGAGQVPRATAWDVTAGVLSLAGVLGMLLAGVTGILIILPLAGTYILFALANWPWGARGRPEPALRREMDAFVALGVVGTVASAGFLQLSMIVARLSDGVANAGQYAAALALATPPSLLALSLSMVLFPSMAEAWGRKDAQGFNRQTDRATRALVTAMTGVLGPIALCSSLIVALIWGDRYGTAAHLLPILLMAILANTVGVACTNALTSRAHRGMVTSTISSLTGMAVGLIAWVLLAPTWGVLGVAIGYLCGTAVIAGIPVALIWRRDGHKWAGLAARAGLGLALLISGLVAESVFGVSLWVEPIVATVFLAFWVFIVRKDAKELLSTMRGRFA